MMYRLFTATALTLTLTLSAAAQAQDEAKMTPGTLGLEADGTWDCKDDSGTYLGAVVIAELSYAFINPDRSVGSYGKLNRDDWMDKPAFFVLSGELKDRFGAIGMALRGPGENFEDLTDWSKNVLQVVVTPEQVFYCDQRRGPAG